jgi:ABC-type molybdate transport system ATPase subunit
MLEFIKKDSDLIMSEYTLEKAMVDGKIDDIQEVLKNGSLFNVFLHVGKSMEEANKIADKILYIEGRISAFKDIMEKFAKDI